MEVKIQGADYLVQSWLMSSGAVKEFVSTILGQRCHNQFRATCADVN